MSVSFDAYKMFYYTGKYLNITRAASELFLSQSTVSRGLQSLESYLGCKLFERTRHGVALTPEGEALYGFVSDACEQIFRGEEFIRQKSGRVLRIGAADFVSNFFVMPVLDELYKSGRNIKLEIASKGFNSFDAAVSSLLSGKTDLACVAAGVEEMYPHDDLDIVCAAGFHDILIAGEDHPELRSGSYSLDELTGFPFVSLNVEASSEPVLTKLFKSRSLQIAPEFETDSVEVFRSVVRKGRCLALIPEFFMDYISEEGQLFEVQTKDPLPEYIISIITEKNALKTDLDREFVSRLTQYIQSSMKQFSGAMQRIQKQMKGES